MGTVMDMSHLLLFFFTISAAVTLGGCQSVEDIAESLQLIFTLNGNYDPAADRSSVSLTLRNIGQQAITNGSWSIYFCSIRMVAPDDIYEDGATRPEGVPIANSGFTVFHVAGCLFRFEPNENFQDIAVGTERVLNYVTEHWMVARSDVMPNFYIGRLNGEAAVIPNTMDEMVNFANSFSSPNQYKRLLNDLYAPYTSQQRYDRYVANDTGDDQLRIIPKPISMDIESVLSVQIDSTWVVYDNTGNTDISFEATYLAEKLGIFASTSSAATNVIELRINNALDVAQCENNPERYEVDIADNRIIITGAQMSGVFYGAQTLLAAITVDRRIGTGRIDDCPRFGYRGFMIDVGRHFVPLEEILRFLDAMAMYKLNKFHFHLSDDEGWRIEIDALRELTMVGANQCHDLRGDDCIMPQLGSPPSKESSGSGFYSIEEYQNILEYANNLHIQVIPEIDMPGHSHAMIKAMDYRNRTTSDSTHILHDPADTSRYLSVQYFSDNSINPCINSTYTFVETIIDAFIDMHSDIQPLEVFHWGGDEVPETAWLESPECEALIEDDPSLEFNATSRDLKGYFARRVQEIIFRKGLASASWEDGVISDEEGTPLEILGEGTSYAYAWDNVWEWGGAGQAYRLANSGYQLILSPATHTYFDHPTEPHPEERGYYWATRFTDSYKTFSFVASDVYKNIDVSRMGDRLDPAEVCPDNTTCPELQGSTTGLQGQVWLETMRTAEHVHGMVFPRLIALAERAWHRAEWEDIEDASARELEIQTDWQGFANRVGYRELARLDDLGIAYNVRPPAVLTGDNNALSIKTEFPGLRVEVSTDWGVSWQQYFAGMAVTDSDAIYVTKSADGSRRSRPVKYDSPEPEEPEEPSTGCSIKQCSLAVFCLVVISLKLWH